MDFAVVARERQAILMLNLGSKLSVRCYDGATRTGRIIYIHPDGIFAVLEFMGISGSWREAILLDRSKPDETPAAVGHHSAFRCQNYTPEEDKAIMTSDNLAATARSCGRTYTAVRARRDRLRRRMRE